MWKKLSKRLCKAAGIVALLVLCGVAIGPLLRFMRRHSPDPLSRVLEQADEKAWLNNGSFPIADIPGICQLADQ
jgi:hypothetical protein